VRWDILATGMVVAMSPLSIVCFVLLLSSPRGLAKGFAFILGWMASLAIIEVATLSVTGGRPPRTNTGPATLVSAILVTLGVVLVAAGVRFSRQAKRPPDDKTPPKWMARVDTIPLWGAASLGALIQPWPFVAAGAALIASINISAFWSWVALIGFSVLATSTFLAMQGYVIFSREDAIAGLGRLRTWVDGHRTRIFEVLTLVLGSVLIVKGILGLAA